MKNFRNGWTDYPFTFLGDKEGNAAPIRKIRVTGYDRNKYVSIIVDGVVASIKSGYVYKHPIRGSKGFSKNSLKTLPIPNDSEMRIRRWLASA